jgi:hypothetical protein
VKPAQPAFTLGRETYQGGKWIEIRYGRPLQRGRDLFGSGPNYGKAANDVGAPGLPPPPVWRAGANVTTRLNTEVPLRLGRTTVPPGDYGLFIDLKLPAWTLIISNWPAQQKYDANNKTALWGAYGYTPDKDVARVPMKVEALPYSVEELTYVFTDVTGTSATLRLMWDTVTASVGFKVAP